MSGGKTTKGMASHSRAQNSAIQYRSSERVEKVPRSEIIPGLPIQWPNQDRTGPMRLHLNPHYPNNKWMCLSRGEVLRGLWHLMWRQISGAFSLFVCLCPKKNITKKTSSCVDTYEPDMNGRICKLGLHVEIQWFVGLASQWRCGRPMAVRVVLQLCGGGRSELPGQREEKNGEEEEDGHPRAQCARGLAAPQWLWCQYKPPKKAAYILPPRSWL